MKKEDLRLDNKLYKVDATGCVEELTVVGVYYKKRDKKTIDVDFLPNNGTYERFYFEKTKSGDLIPNECTFFTDKKSAYLYLIELAKSNVKKWSNLLNEE